MRRIQLHLTDEQDERLGHLARRAGVARAELIRRGIDLLLREETRDDPLLSLVGAAGSAGRDDISEQHDRVLYASDVAPPRKAKKNGQRRS
jgi:hypothetical protein